jgi:hypothetical protein
MEKRGQISVEYLIVIGFVVFIVISILGVAFLYAAGIQDRIKTNQLENFANKVISSSESVFFAGEPSRVTITAYLPEGVESVSVVDDNGYYLVFNVSTSSGLDVISFSSDVPLDTGTIISVDDGTKRLLIESRASKVLIGEV